MTTMGVSMRKGKKYSKRLTRLRFLVGIRFPGIPIKILSHLGPISECLGGETPRRVVGNGALCLTPGECLLEVFEKGSS